MFLVVHSKGPKVLAQYSNLQMTIHTSNTYIPETLFLAFDAKFKLCE